MVETSAIGNKVNVEKSETTEYNPMPLEECETILDVLELSPILYILYPQSL